MDKLKKKKMFDSHFKTKNKYKWNNGINAIVIVRKKVCFETLSQGDWELCFDNRGRLNMHYHLVILMHALICFFIYSIDLNSSHLAHLQPIKFRDFNEESSWNFYIQHV